MIAWLGDTGGYFAGRFLGKTKLYEAVSPKKTREGFIGSIFGSVCGALLAHFWYLPSLPLGSGIIARDLRRRARPIRRPRRIAPQALHRHQRLRLDRPRARRNSGSHRRAPGRESDRLSVYALVREIAARLFGNTVPRTRTARGLVTRRRARSAERLREPREVHRKAGRRERRSGA